MRSASFPAAFSTAAEVFFLIPGTNAAGVADPFYNLKSLNYTFSTFPGTMVQETAAGGMVQVFNPKAAPCSRTRLA